MLSFVRFFFLSDHRECISMLFSFFVGFSLCTKATRAAQSNSTDVEKPFLQETRRAVRKNSRFGFANAADCIGKLGVVILMRSKKKSVLFG